MRRSSDYPSFTMRRRAAAVTLASLCGLAFAAGGASPAAGQPSTFPDPIAEIQTSYETAVDHAFGPFIDEELLRLRTSAPPSHVLLVGLPDDADIDAYEWLGRDLVWFSLADWALLPGGLRVHPADIVQWNGSNYSKIFDLLACGGAPGLNLDALDANPGLFGGTILLVSFDTNQTFLVNGAPVTVFDEELVTYQPGSCQFGATAIQLVGSDRRWDLDGLGMTSRWGVLLDSLLYLSYDTWVEPAPGLHGGPATLVTYRTFGATWSSPLHGDYQGIFPDGDLDAVWILEAGLFEDGFETGTTFRWSAAEP